MADISTELARILSAIYGEDVRGSIHDAIEKINDVSEVVLTTGTAVTGPSSSSTGFYDDSLYLNTDTFELWKCTGVNTWASQGILKGDPGADGADGNGIASITKTATSGLVDTYTITYTDGTTSTFTVTNGEDGANGNKWYRGTGISGKSALPTVYTTSGVADANSGDMFLNPSEGAVYSCVTGGVPTVATWQYEMTLSGGGGGTSDYADLTNKPQINGHELSGNQTGADLGLANSSDIPTVDQTYSATSSNAQSGTAVASAISGKADTADVPTELNDLTDVTITGTPSQGETLIADANGVFKNQPMPQGGHTMLPTPSASLTEAQVVKAIDAATGANENVPSLFGIRQWTNEKKVRRVMTGTTPIGNASIGSTGIGAWTDKDPSDITTADEADWWQDNAFIIPNNSDDIDLTLKFDPSSGEPVTLGGYILDTTTGKLCIKFGNSIATPANAKIAVDITYTRNEVS